MDERRGCSAYGASADLGMRSAGAPPMRPPSGVGTPRPPPPLSMDMDVRPEEITPAPEIPMQAAPRDDSLSEGEKEDILSDLGED